MHRVLNLFDSHYQGLNRTTLSGGWAAGSFDDYCNQLEEDCASFARAMADVTLKDLDLIP